MGGGGDPSAGLKRCTDSRLPGSILGQPRLAGGLGQAASCCSGQLPRVGEATQPLRATGTQPHTLRPPGLTPWGSTALALVLISAKAECDLIQRDLISHQFFPQKNVSKKYR